MEKRILTIGHRGAKAHLPENTLEGIAKALELGVSGIEIDVHCCRTGELVVIHDFTLDRTTDGSGEVALKSWKELKALKVEGSFRIPLLEQVMDLVRGKALLNIELKGAGTAPATAELIKEQIRKGAWSQEELLISSFQKKELEDLREEYPELRLGVLSKSNMTEAIRLAGELEAYAVHPSLGIISQSGMLQARAAGLQVIVWTVNAMEDMERMKDLSVDGIISDHPDRLMKIFGP